MFSSPYVRAAFRAVVGGLVVAVAAATPLVDDGVVASEVLSIAAAFLTGSGATAYVHRPSVKADAWEGGA